MVLRASAICILTVVVTVQLTQAYYFDYYVFAQQWPASFCFNDNSTLSTRYGHKADKCDLPKNITSWTVHGLWPSVNESYPYFCNNSWKLNESDFEPLVDTMRARWPSFNEDSTYFEFWDHEWSKHGTCASNVSILHGPYNYFKYTLQLNAQLDLLKNLATTVRMFPGYDHCYDYNDVNNGMKHLFNESVILGCTWDSKAKKQHLAQIEVCFDKQFNMNCDPTVFAKRKPTNYKLITGTAMPEVTPCSKTQQICYFSIEHSND